MPNQYVYSPGQVANANPGLGYTASTGTTPTVASSSAPTASQASAPAQQSPGVFGTGQYYAPAYAGFDPTGLSGLPAQGATTDYGLNGVWSNLQNFVQSAPQNYAVAAPTASAAQGNAAYGQAAQGNAAYGQAAQGQASSYSAALAQAAQSRAAQAQGATMGAATAGPAAMTGAPQISMAGDASQLAVQQNLENTLQTQANGGGTSAADLQLQQGEQQQVANQLAVLGSQRGGAMNAGLAQNQAANQSAQAQAQLNAQMGIQRAQETQAAQQALGTVAGTARGQSQSYNTAQAGLSSTANLANQSAANQMAQFNTSDEQAANLANAQLAQGNSQFNATNLQNTSLANAQLSQAANLSNQGAVNTASATNAGNAQAMTLANLLAQNNMTSQNVGNAQAMTLANLLAQNNQTQQNVGNAQAMGLANLGNAQQTNLANLSAASQYGLANQTAAETSANQYYQNVLAALGAQTGIGEADRSADLASQQLGVQQQLGIDQINAQAYQAAANANANLTGAVFGGVAGAGSSALNSLFKSGGSSGTGTGTSTVGTGTNPDTGTGVNEGNAQTGDQSYSDGGTGDDGAGDVSLSQNTSAANIGFPATTSPTTTYQKYLQQFGGPNLTSLSDENVKEGIAGGNPMMRSFLDQLGSSKSDQSIDPNADMGFRLASYGKQTASSGPSDGGIGAKLGSAAGGAAAGAAMGSVVPGIGTAIGGILGALFGGAIGGGVDGSGSTSSRNVMTSPGTGETATAGTITDLDDQNAISTSDDEAKEDVISGNRGMQAFLQQAGAQQGSTNNAFMQTGQAPSAATDRQMPATPPYAQGYGQSNGGGVYGGGQGNAGGFSGDMATYAGRASQPSPPPFAQTPPPSAGGFSGGQGSSGGIWGDMATYAGGGVTSAGGVAATSAGSQSPRGGVQSFGGASGTPTAPNVAGLGSMGGAVAGQSPGFVPGQAFATTTTPTLSPIAQALRGISAASSPAPTFPVSQSIAQAPPYLPSGQPAPQYSPPQGSQYSITKNPSTSLRLSALSDENAKADVHYLSPDGLSPDDMRDFLDALHAHQYRYKEPDLPGAGHGTFVSPMAQEIESTPLGRPAVSTNPQTGYKQVDYSKLAGTQLAGLAYLNERQNKLEQLLRATNGMAP
ncbi:MAG TPA: tail fiber domain-containing protein [Polyangiaceae bacterium]|jgi:hypothetical protein|nr:tail fiber domain-containing protein [Polyangiaceae bacterium]